MNKSILFLTNAYPDFEASYRGVFIRKMAMFLQREGYEISVVTPKIYGESRLFEQRDGIKVYRFPFFAGNKLLIEYPKIPYFRMLLYYMTGTLFVPFVMLRNQCDLIHVHWAIPTGPLAILAGFLLRKPFLVTIHGSDLRMATGDSPLLRKVFVCVCRRARRITCVSKTQKRELEELGIDGTTISTFPMGIEEDFLKEGMKRERRSNGQSLTILSNRNLLPDYNVSLLIRAVPYVLQEEPGARFLIAGSGSEKENLEREAVALKVNPSVRFLDRVAHEEMANLLAQADVYVSTSLHDGTSVSLLEAMAAGTFPVVTDIPANREWIKDGQNGFLVPARDEKLLARRIVDALRNRKLLQESRATNFALVKENALWPSVIRKTEEFYLEILGLKN